MVVEGVPVGGSCVVLASAGDARVSCVIGAEP